MARMMKNRILIRCSRCGITERHSQPEHFVDSGWTARNSVPFCPHCKQMIDEYEEFRIYFEYLKKQESEQLAALRTERK
ncbi:MAG: hypothetical protein IJ642_12115 [Oscillospiraceae bacterium]|nr:hypothetical protein [Oscillospiraceae bacterium]